MFRKKYDLLINLWINRRNYLFVVLILSFFKMIQDSPKYIYMYRNYFDQKLMCIFVCFKYISYVIQRMDIKLNPTWFEFKRMRNEL